MVAIKNFSIPKTCDVCNISYYDSDGDLRCPLSDYQSVETCKKQRNKDCPLVNIKLVVT